MYEGLFSVGFVGPVDKLSSINIQTYSMLSSLNKTDTKHFRGISHSILFSKPPLDGNEVRFKSFSITGSWKSVTQRAQEKSELKK
jgi:hypothetical protein